MTNINKPLTQEELIARFYSTTQVCWYCKTPLKIHEDLAHSVCDDCHEGIKIHVASIIDDLDKAGRFN